MSHSCAVVQLRSSCHGVKVAGGPDGPVGPKGLVEAVCHVSHLWNKTTQFVMGTIKTGSSVAEWCWVSSSSFSTSSKAPPTITSRFREWLRVRHSLYIRVSAAASDTLSSAPRKPS